MPGRMAPNDPRQSLLYGGKGLADMIAAGLRGTTAAGFGLPGDIETLGRMGINFGGKQLGLSDQAVDPEPYIPNTERVSEMLPKFKSLTGENFDVAQKMGEFVPGPTLLSGIRPAAKTAGKVADALRGPEKIDMGRRAALQNIGKGAAIAGTAAVAPGAIVKALKAAGEAAPLEGALAKTAVRAGAGALTRSAGMGITAKMIKDVATGGFFPEEVIPHLEKAFPKASDAELAKVMENIGYLHGRNGTPNSHAWSRFDYVDYDGKLRPDAPAFGGGKLDWKALEKQGINNEEEMLHAVATGKVKPADLSHEVFLEMDRFGDPARVRRKAGPLSHAYYSMEGWSEPHEMLSELSKEQLIKHTDEVRAAAKKLGHEDPYSQRILDEMIEDLDFLEKKVGKEKLNKLRGIE